MTAPPGMASWNLALRFALEIAALVGLGLGAASAAGVVGAIVVPLVAAIGWGTLNVPDDPSRSGRAPVPVAGSVRLALEPAVLLAGAGGFLIAGRPAIAAALTAAIVAHYANSIPRLTWLLGR